MADTFRFEGIDYPLISTRKNGDRLIGYANTELAEELYAAGTPPVHGLAAGSGTERVSLVRIGHRLRIDRHGNHWFASDDHGTIGRLRWSQADQGRRHAVTGKPMHFPDLATMEVRRLVINPDGIVVNFAGTAVEAERI